MKVAVITDSAANLTKEYLFKHKNLFVVPLMIQIDEESYKDQVEITSDLVYEKMNDHNIKTSLPSMSDLEEVLEEIIKEGYEDVFVVSISSGLSGTYSSFRLKFAEYEDKLNITLYDSKTLAGHQGLLVEEAVNLIKENTPMDKIVLALDKLRFEDSIGLYTINTLKYLKKGGRIGKIEATIGDLLNIKPIITVDENGVYTATAKSFGIKRAILNMGRLLTNKFKDEEIDLVIHYGDDLEQAESLKRRLLSRLNVRNVVISQLTPVLGIHTGPEMFAFIARLV